VAAAGGLVAAVDDRGYSSRSGEGRVNRRETPRSRAPEPLRLLNALPQPLLAIDKDGQIVEVNTAAENFFEMGRSALTRSTLRDLLPFGSPVFALIADALASGSTVNGYRLDISTPRTSKGRLVDAFIAPLPTIEGVAVLLQERSIAEKMDRQLTHRSAARSVTALGSMLAHEIKNPLSGIRGAAQLLESSVSDEDRGLTQLICEETDRIVKLVDRMQSFADQRPQPRESLNIHAVLDRVKRLAQAGFARHVRFSEVYDPSLPHVFGNRDQLIQVFLNLMKNAAEAIGAESIDGEIAITTAFRPGMRLKSRGGAEPVSLPLEICIRDNGCGISSEIAANLFDPFVTTKSQGSGLGLALVAKVIGDHGGIVECESLPRKTTFRVLMPVDATRPRLEG
jgi:two-component system nitrogen regulation sensor histidine kinase GlnL